MSFNAVTPWRCWFRRSFHIAWTTATHSSTAYTMDWWPGCNLSNLLSGARRHDYITSVLHQLHWLPVRKRVNFKMTTLVYSSLSSMAPAYLAADCQPVCDEGRRQLLLRSAYSRTCVVVRTYSNFGDRCFAAAGPKLRNSCPAGLRQTDIGYEQFKWSL